MKLREEFEIKCQAYDIISLVNDEYLKVNNALKRENTQLEQKNDKLQRELSALKAQQLKVSKPFVDLTCDDDSDVEIVDEKKLEASAKIPDTKPSEVIEVDDDPVVNKEDCKTIQQPNSELFTMINYLDSKNNYANESYQSLQEFENFILDQI